MSDTLVELSRWQFALTAMFHFILSLNPGTEFFACHYGIGLRDDWQRNIQADDSILGKAVWD